MGGKQLGFTGYEPTSDKKRTKWHKYLAEMEAIEPWKVLTVLNPPLSGKMSPQG
jgi:hypothetical protein